jgi:hypothetical protein
LDKQEQQMEINRILVDGFVSKMMRTHFF